MHNGGMCLGKKTMKSGSWIVVAVSTLAFPAACAKANPDEHFAKGNDFFEKQRLAEAIIEYRSAVQADPSRGDIRGKLAEAYFSNRDGAAALREAVVAADLLPTDVSAQVRAGNLLLLAGQFEDAKDRAEKALAIDSKSVPAIVLMANSMAGLKDLDGALAEFHEAIALRPEGDDLYASAGLVQLARGDRKAAEATFRQALEVAPTSVQARVSLAGFMWADNRPAEAEALLKEAIGLDPKNLSANRAFGVFLTANKRAAEAEPYFRTIAEIRGTDQSRLSLADFYLGQRRYDEATGILKGLADKPEMFEAATVRLAAIEVRRNNTAGAAGLIKSILDRTPGFMPARLFDLRLRLASRQFDEVLALGDKIVNDEPHSRSAAEVHFLMGQVQTMRDLHNDALEHYEEALRLLPQSPAIALALAQLHHRLGRPERVETYARQVLASDPKNPVARTLVVRAKLARNDDSGAAAEIARLERDYPNSVAVMNLVAARHLAAGRLDAARTLYSKVASEAPDDLEALGALSEIDLRARRFKETAERIERALGRMPHTSDLLVISAVALARLGDTSRAEALLKEAIDKEPARLQAYSQLAELYARQNRLADARDQFRGVVQRDPRSVGANTMLGMVLHMQGDLKGAEEQYLRTLAIDSEAAVAANNLAWMLMESNRNLDQAMQLAQAAMRKLPEDPHVNDTMGWIYYRKSMFPSAIRHLETSVARDPANPVPQYHLGMALYQNGDIDKAKKALQRALAQKTPFAGIDEAKKTLNELEGKGR
jgi:tetratricopeptide (TPR) repeat protein